MALRKIVITSGYFNPLHSGHLNLFKDARRSGDFLVVIVNNDAQVALKGSVPFMKEQERMDIIDNIRHVDAVFLSVDTDATVSKSLEEIAKRYEGEFYFAKGGDRNRDNIPESEKDVCQRFNIQVINGVGGGKVQSSSWLLDSIKQVPLSEIHNTKVLITGGGGFIGTHIAKNLADKGYSVRLFDLNFINYDFLSEKLGGIPNAEKITGNIMNPEELAKAAKGCRYVVHAAAMLGVRNTEQKKLDCLNVNILGTINVLNACVTENVEKIIFASSSEVYGEPIEIPIKETNPTSPVSLYGVSKLAGEEYMKAYAHKYGLKYSIVRFFSVYGPGQVAEFVMPKFIKNVLENKSPIVHGSGSQSRTFCYVEDAADGVARALIQDNGHNRTFNIGNDEGSISMKDLAEKIIKISGKNLQPTFVSMQDSDREESREIHRRVPLIYQARSMLNYQPRFSLDEGIRKTMEAGFIFDTWNTN